MSTALRPYHEKVDLLCLICSKALDDCTCPECPECRIIGDPDCITRHGLVVEIEK